MASRGGRAFQHQGVHERLWEVASHLAFGHVVFLAIQPGSPARGPVPLEPAGGVHLAALLLQGQGHQEPAQQESTLGLLERPLVMTEPVGIAVLRQLGHVGTQRLDRARIVGGHCTADGRQQKRGVQGAVSG